MNETLSLGLIIMLVGMGVVFAFLVIMIFVMQIATKVINHINKIWPEEIPQIKTTNKKTNKSADEEIALAIACAFEREANTKC